MYDLLSLADVEFQDVVSLSPDASEISEEIGVQLKREALYANYIERQKKDVAAMKKDEEGKKDAGDNADFV